MEAKKKQAQKKGSEVASKKRQIGTPGLLILLFLTVFGSVLFVMAVSGQLGGGKVVLDEEYICAENCDGEYMELSVEDYEGLVQAGKSFIIFVDQDGCTTADRLEGYLSDWAMGKGVKAYKMMFSDVKESPLHDKVKFYPSVAIIGDGQVRAYLRADSNDDAGIYNNYDDFYNWINSKMK